MCARVSSTPPHRFTACSHFVLYVTVHNQGEGRHPLEGTARGAGRLLHRPQPHAFRIAPRTFGHIADTSFRGFSIARSLHSAAHTRRPENLQATTTRSGAPRRLTGTPVDSTGIDITRENKDIYYRTFILFYIYIYIWALWMALWMALWI
jgi:hypothetical protein